MTFVIRRGFTTDSSMSKKRENSPLTFQWGKSKGRLTSSVGVSTYKSIHLVCRGSTFLLRIFSYGSRLQIFGPGGCTLHLPVPKEQKSSPSPLSYFWVFCTMLRLTFSRLVSSQRQNQYYKYTPLWSVLLSFYFRRLCSRTPLPLI